MAMRWFRRKASTGGQAEKSVASATVMGAESAPAGQPLIQHVPGVKVDVVVSLPDGGKARSTHYARIGSPSLGRVRIGARNLALNYTQSASGAVTVFGAIAAAEGVAAFDGQAEEAVATEWTVHLVDGVASVRITAHREDVPA